jgi:hypothetical protein
VEHTDPDFDETVKRKTHRGKRLLALLWIGLMALMFGGAGISLLFRSTETADAILGLLLAGIAVFTVVWVYRNT